MDDLLIKYLLGEADPVKQERVRRWLAADERNGERARQFTVVHDLSGRILPPAPAWQEAYHRFTDRVQKGQLKPPQGMHRLGKYHAGARGLYQLRGRWQAAALLAGLLFLSAATYLLLKKVRNIPERVAEVTVSNPGSVRLSDGTIVGLAPNTTITYTFDRETSERTIHLKGTAAFSVAPDPSRPFLVLVNDLTIKVLGTSFTVRNTPDSTLIELATGVVEVNNGKNKRIVKAGETLKAFRGLDSLLVTGPSPISASYKSSPPQIITTGKTRSSADTTIHWDDPRKVMRSIIRDLIKEKIVSNKDSLKWFGLDKGQFVVNDKPMPDSLLIKFRSIYIRPDGMGYYYGSVKVTGRGYFFEKTDIYEH